MSAPPADRIVHDAHIGPDDTPHEAAAHLWTQVVANHDVDPDGPLGRLGVFDRVVLVLHDVLGLSSSTVAEVLHTEEAAVTSAHAAARSRVGLPVDGGHCDAWQDIRDAHAPGDPEVLTGLTAHAADCPTCSGTVADDQQRMHRGWLGRGLGATTAGAAAVAAPALGGTLAAAAAIVAAGVAVGALVGPVPEPPPPEPVVVDADPGLPSDEEPVDGWPAQRPVTTVDESGGADDDADSPADGEDAPQADTDQADEPTDPITDTVDDVTDTIDETVDDVTDTATDTVDETTDTVTDTTDEVTDTVDETTGGATDDLTDAVDETTSDAGDAVDDLVDDTNDALP